MSTAFLAAASKGDLEALMAALAPEVVHDAWLNGTRGARVDLAGKVDPAVNSPSKRDASPRYTRSAIYAIRNPEKLNNLHQETALSRAPRA